MVYRVVGQGKASGLKLEMDTFNIWTVSNGTIMSCITYDQYDEALKAAGLRE